MKKLKIRIITAEPFPIGMANTNRIMSYGKGLAEQNCEVIINCIKPTESSSKIFNTKTNGTIDGFQFEYTSGNTIISNNYLKRQLDNFRGVLNLCLKILFEKKKSKTDVLIYYTLSPIVAIFLYLITRFRKVIFLKEESEFPFVYYGNKGKLSRYLIDFHYKLFDGLLLMTNTLIKYFSEEKKITVPYLHVPMTVDFERFNSVQRLQNMANNYIAYCGVLNNEKDGVDILIKAFISLASEFPNLELYLIGDPISEKILQDYKFEIEKNNCSHRVHFTGRVGSAEVASYISNADVLVLPRPKSLQAEGGFPTKLGEYLSTGKPVVVTNVGEISFYLKHELNAYIINPGSIESLFNQLKSILLNYPQALETGTKGKSVALANFNYKIQALNIFSFIQHLRQKNIISN
ncbi:MAG: glycosyltransferase family 4 protein [Ginsengibacter sp.]